MSTYAPSQSVAEWERLFPLQVTENYTSSVTFMKQLTVIAVSTITYMKNVFPDDSYTSETFAGAKLRILMKKCKDELAQFVSTALTQAFEAFDKKFLQKLVLCFYDTECRQENLIEYHIFEYVYTPEGASLSVHSTLRDTRTHTAKYTFDNVREKTVNLIKACVVILQACQSEMPESYDICLRLYYNDDAPEGYQAPGFAAGDEFLDHFAHTLGDATHVGSVRTPFHTLSLRTYFKECGDSSHDAIPSQNPPVMTLNEQDDFQSSAQKSVSEGEQIVCPCNKTDNDGTHALLICHYCGTAQHAACFGVRRAHARARARHCCAACHDADRSRPPTDARLAELPAMKRECLCIFRRTLEWLGARAAVRARDLMQQFGISPVNATKLMKLLHAHDILDRGPDPDLESPRAVIPENLAEDMKKFFQNDETNIVDRLIQETLSQESHADPVGDVLGPMEKVHLQNTATVCRVVEPLQKPAYEDATLKQYRDAILSNEVVEDGLPLSGSHNPIDVENKTPVKRKAKGKKTGVKSKKSKNK